MEIDENQTGKGAGMNATVESLRGIGTGMLLRFPLCTTDNPLRTLPEAEAANAPSHPALLEEAKFTQSDRLNLNHTSCTDAPVTAHAAFPKSLNGQNPKVPGCRRQCRKRRATELKESHTSPRIASQTEEGVNEFFCLRTAAKTSLLKQIEQVRKNALQI